MRQGEIEIYKQAVELIKAHEFYCSKGVSPDAIPDPDAPKVTLFYDDVKDMYALALDYEKRLLRLQKILEREIKLINKSYGIRSSGVMDEEAVLEAVELIKNNLHLTGKR